MSIAVQIVCDGCGLVVNCGKGVKRERVHVVRSRLQNEGWKIDPPVDICGTCRGKR